MAPGGNALLPSKGANNAKRCLVTAMKTLRVLHHCQIQLTGHSELGYVWWESRKKCFEHIRKKLMRMKSSTNW